MNLRLFKQIFVLCSLEVIFQFLIKISKSEAIEIDIAFFVSLGILMLHDELFLLCLKYLS